MNAERHTLRTDIIHTILLQPRRPRGALRRAPHRLVRVSSRAVSWGPTPRYVCRLRVVTCTAVIRYHMSWAERHARTANSFTAPSETLEETLALPITAVGLSRENFGLKWAFQCPLWGRPEVEHPHLRRWSRQSQPPPNRPTAARPAEKTRADSLAHPFPRR